VSEEIQLIKVSETEDVADDLSIADDATVNNNVNENNADGPKLRLAGTSVVMIEYIMIANLNDQAAQAHELGQLLSPIKDYILLNLIPYNPTNVKEDFQAPTREDVEKFQQICYSAPYFVHTRIRQEMGQDISGACGQLALSNPKTCGDVDMEDISGKNESSKSRNMSSVSRRPVTVESKSAVSSESTSINSNADDTSATFSQFYNIPTPVLITTTLAFATLVGFAIWRVKR
jgi:hypothetical protein